MNVGDVFKGRELAAKKRDGDFGTAEMLVHADTFDARGGRKGERQMRVEVPHDTLRSGPFGSTGRKFEVMDIRNNTILIRPRA